MAANDNECSRRPDSGAAVESEGESAANVPGGEVLIDSLPFASQFAIWSVRVWVTALKLEQPFEAISGNTFRRFDLMPAQEILDELMLIVANGASRQIDIRCLKCSHVSPDEMLFHDALADAQRGAAFAAYDGLRAWLAPAAARIAYGTLVRLGNLFGSASLHLASQRSGAVARQRAMGAEPACRPHASPTLH